MNRNVWVVGQQGKPIWELGGIFSTEEAAIAACTEETDCYWELPMDQDLGRETIEKGIFPNLNVPEGWYIIGPASAVPGDGVFFPGGEVTILDENLFDKMPIVLRRKSWAVRRKA